MDGDVDLVVDQGALQLVREDRLGAQLRERRGLVPVTLRRDLDDVEGKARSNPNEVRDGDIGLT
jgi:hypothetical protein